MRAALIRAFRAVGYSRASIAARFGWITRRKREQLAELEAVRADLLDTSILHGRNPAHREVLATMKRDRDQRYLDFIDAATELDLSPQEAVNEWFSPKIQGE